jgi:hypothetical protein
MWYRIAVDQANQYGTPLQGIAQELNVVPEKFYPELQETLQEIGIDPNQYKDLPDHAKKSIWDVIVHKLDKNTYNSFEDTDTPGMVATQARRHSPYHSNPTETTVENQLEELRHDTIDNVPNNMLQAEKGRGGMTLLNGNGFPQYSSGKGDPSVFMDNLPSTVTLV